MVDRERRQTYIRYTIGFFVILAIVAAYFACNGKTPIWENFDKDGLTQHYSSLAYLGRYLRDILRNLVEGNGLVIPEWNFSIGYGADIFTTLHYYAFGDPLNLLTVFVPSAYTEILYVVLLILRIYLAGVAFIAFCRYHGNRGIATILGAWIYIFAAYTLVISIHYPFFYNVLIYFPLILLGADKILKKEKPYLFILITAVSALSSFYFFYGQCLMLVLYVVFRYVYEYGKPRLRTLLPLIGKFLAYGMVGVMMAAVILLPVVTTMFGSQRAAADNYVPALYDLHYYLKTAVNPLSVNGIGYNNYMGYAALAVLGVFTLFVKRNVERSLKTGLILLFVFTLIPFVGHVMNGFSYVTNRWQWALLLLVSYAFVRAFPYMLRLSRQEKKRLLLLTFIYTGLCLLPAVGATEQVLGALLILVVTTGVVCMGPDFFGRRTQLYKLILSLLLVLNLGLNIDAIYNPYMADNLDEYTDAGSAWSKMAEEVPSSLLDEKQVATVRYDQFGTNENHNTAILSGKLSTDYYYSLSNGLIGQFFQELNINFPYEMIYTDLDSRMALDALMSVKYFVTPIEGRGNIPAQFAKKIGNKEIDGRIYEAYETETNLPLGYTYDSYIPRADYEKMTALEKQQALLQGVVMEENSLPETALSFDDEEIPYTVTCDEGVIYENNRIVVTDVDVAHMVIHLEKEVPDAEIYVSMQNTDIVELQDREKYTDVEWDALSTLEKNRARRNDRFRTALDNANIQFCTKRTNRTIKIRNAKNDYYCGRTDFVTNLGCDTIKEGDIDVYFSKNGIYTFDKLSFHAQPTASLRQKIDQRKQESLKKVKLAPDTLTGEISVSRDKILCLSLPYSNGWSAYVDGKKAEILQVNTMMMGVSLEQGNHSIRLVYNNPALYMGGWISLVGCLIFIILCLVDFWIQRRKK